eukprot:gene34003-43932_t
MSFPGLIVTPLGEPLCAAAHTRLAIAIVSVSATSMYVARTYSPYGNKFYLSSKRGEQMTSSSSSSSSSASTHDIVLIDWANSMRIEEVEAAEMVWSGLVCNSQAALRLGPTGGRPGCTGSSRVSRRSCL